MSGVSAIRQGIKPKRPRTNPLKSLTKQHQSGQWNTSMTPKSRMEKELVRQTEEKKLKNNK
jgi:hypothetical protein